MPRPAVSSRILLIAAGAAALAAPPLLLRAEPEHWSTVRAAVEQNLSQPERDRLERNTKEYLALSETDRQKYRALHAKLSEDTESGNQRLTGTMRDYYAWLASNQAYDRQIVTAITDPGQRIAEIQRIVDKRNAATSRSRSRFSRFVLRNGVPELSPEQLQALMAEIENRLDINDEELGRLVDSQGHEKTGVARHFTVFNILRAHRQNLVQFLERHDSAELTDAAGIPMPPEFGTATPEDQRQMVMRMIVGNVAREFELAVHGRRPSTADLEKVVADWSPDPAEQQKLDETLELEPSDFRREVERAHARDAIALDFDDLREMAPDIFGRSYFGGRARGGPQDGERGPDRRPLGQPPERFNPEQRDGRPPFPPRHGERPRPDQAGDRPPGDRPPEDRPPGDRPPGDRPPGEPRPGDQPPPPPADAEPFREGGEGPTSQ